MDEMTECICALRIQSASAKTLSKNGILRAKNLKYAINLQHDNGSRKKFFQKI